MREYRLNIAPGQTEEIAVEGQYFRIHESAVLVTIETRPSDRKSAAQVTLSEGNDVKTAPFKALRVRHSDAGVREIILYVSNEGEIRSSAIAGTVSIDNLPSQQGAFTQSRASVTNVNQVLIAANAARRYLLIQNNDAAQVLRFTLNGNAATAAQGFRLAPGDSYSLEGYAATSAVNAMMEVATAAVGNVEFCEG